MRVGPRDFKHVTALDFEFYAPPGENPRPLCLVTRDIETGATRHFWEDELRAMAVAPYPTGQDALSLAFYASAELGCFLSLKWPLPHHVLDLFTEYRCLTNNRPVSGDGLLHALSWYGIDGLEFSEKREMRELAMRGGEYSAEERAALLVYCESDVVAVQKLFERMLPSLDIPRAVFRGKYMGAAARVEFNGIPVEAGLLKEMELKWPEIQGRLIQKVDTQYNVFEGRTFKSDRFGQFLANRGICWPRLETGRLDLKEETFNDMAKVHPEIAPLHQLRVSLGQMRSKTLPIGSDGRNRTILSAFRSVTGRNQPKTSNFIFGRSAWFRNLIRPEPGMALAYVDWSQQEFGIAAALSGDPAMVAAYESGDPYLEFGKQAGSIPKDGSKQTHGTQRDQFKQCALAVLYGGGAELVALRTGLPLIDAKRLIHAHRRSYPTFWRWIGNTVDVAMLGRSIYTVFGWMLHPGPETKRGTLLNFPMQANGAEMMRLAACMFGDAGVRVCAPVHDAFLIEAKVEEIEARVSSAQEIMASASELVLGGALRLRSDAKIIRHPERYSDERGREMWESVLEILSELREERDTHPCGTDPRAPAQDLLHPCVPVPSTCYSTLESHNATRD